MIFHYKNKQLFAEGVALKTIAEQSGTPCYVYSKAAIESRWLDFQSALSGMKHQVCYAVKANSNLAVLQVLARLGAGFDIVSGGELARVLKAGGNPQKIVFSGVGKRHDEIKQALDAGIHCFNVESIEELQRIQSIAQQCGKQAPISLRVNPDVDPKTHPYIATGLKESKFGIDIHQAEAVYKQAATLSHLKVIGIDCHIGSQLLNLDPMFEALDKVLVLVERLKVQGIVIEHLDMGGGFGICYKDEEEPSLEAFGQRIKTRLKKSNLTLLLEPGRSIIGNAGVLLTRVESIKKTEGKNFAIIDAAMNDLARPSLYDAWHEVKTVALETGVAQLTCDIVGPICESGDFLAKDRTLAVAEGHLLAIMSAGAYGFVMSSNYNSRPRPPEVLVDSAQTYVIRKGETREDLMRGETLIFCEARH